MKTRVPRGVRLGYPCQNLMLSASTNHTLRLANLRDHDRLRRAIERNLDDLERVLRWNADRAIRLFRIGQSLIPFASHPRFPRTLNWQREYRPRLAALGRLARRLGVRLSFHPGQYVNPGSPDRRVRRRSVQELRYTARVLALMGQRDALIVLHLGGAYGDRRAAARRFTAALRREAVVRRYLALENDERTWTVEETVAMGRAVRVPVIVDTLHHALRPGTLDLTGALTLARTMWRGGRRPKVHLASQARGKVAGAHARRIRPRDAAALWAALRGRPADVMVEGKDKEIAVLALRHPSWFR